MWSKLIALAVTIPMTITIASAQASQDADIAAYSQDLQMRIARGHQSGQLSQANYNSVQSLYNQVEMIRRSIGNKAMNPVVRMNMMNSLTNLDKQLTGFLHDDVNARYQMWDPTRRSWRNNWWQADRSGANNFDSEINAYQNSLKQRLDQGRQSGQISRRELTQLTNSYTNVDRMQQQYRIGGFSRYERNSLMSMLTQLDKDITTQMHDDERSHYRNWNSNNSGWNNSWWKQPNTSSTPVRDGRPGDWNNRSDANNRPGDWNRGDSHRSDASNRDWNRGDSHRGDASNRDWNRGDSNQGGWKRGDAVQSDSNTKDWNGGSNSNRGNWNNRAGFRESNDSINRSSNPASGTGSGANSTGTSGGGSSTSNGSTTRTYTPPPSSPPANTAPPATNTPPATTSNTPPVSNPPAATNPPSGTGSASTGSTSGEGRRGTWSGERTGEGRGDRSGSRSGSGSGGTGTGTGTGTSDRSGTWERRPQN